MIADNAENLVTGFACQWCGKNHPFAAAYYEFPSDWITSTCECGAETYVRDRVSILVKTPCTPRPALKSQRDGV